MYLGPCEIANQNGQDFDCAPDGTFEPLQCQSFNGVLNCVCVNPSNGAAIAGSEVTVSSRDDAPDCENLGKTTFTIAK